MRPCDLRSPAPVPAPLPSAVRRALHPLPTPGFGFVELLAVIAAGSLLAAATYGFYRKTADARDVAHERTNVAALAENVRRAYAGRNAFGGLTTASALAQGVYPSDMVPRRDGFTSVPNPWGGTVAVAAATVDGGIAGNGFTIAYSNVPPSVCAAFAAAAGVGFEEVTVRHGQLASRDLHVGSVLDAAGRNVDPALAAQRCAAGLSSVAFTHGSFPQARITCAGSGPIPPNAETLTASCPETGATNSLPQLVSDLGPDQYNHTWPQTHEQDGTCGPSGTIVYGPWSPATPTHACADQCIPANSSTTDNRITGCPAGQLVSAPGPYLYQPSWPQTQTVTTSRACATPIGPLGGQQVNVGAWTPMLSCAPACSAPAPSTTTAARACPSGQIDSQAPFTVNGITDTTTRTWTCALPIGLATYVDATTTQNRCAPACVLPTPSMETRCISPVQSSPCPQGQTVGSHTFRLAEARSASCAAPTGAFAWSGWSSTGARCDESNTCAPPPPPSCPPVSTACPAASPAGYTVFGPYANGTGKFCTETKACPAGYSGSNTSYRTDYTAATPTTCASWSPWNVYTPGSGCTATPPGCSWPSAPTSTPACPAPYASTPQTGQWIHGATCPAWVWQQTAPCPACSWSNPPSATPACAGGGNEQGGTWVHAATCPDWVYSGGTCPPPPAPTLYPYCNGTQRVSCMSTVFPPPMGGPPAQGGVSAIVNDDTNCCHTMSNPSDWSIGWSNVHGGTVGAGCAASGNGSNNQCLQTGSCSAGYTATATVRHIPSNTTRTYAFTYSCEVRH